MLGMVSKDFTLRSSSLRMKTEARCFKVTERVYKGESRTKSQDTNVAYKNLGNLVFLSFISGMLKQESCHTFLI